MPESGYAAANADARRRLRELVESLRPEDLAIDVGDGWTVATVLGHMAFWDRWQAGRWRLILAAGGLGTDLDLTPAEHVTNDALESIWPLVAPATAGSLALEAAEAIDAIIAAAPGDVVARLEASPNAYLVHRSEHRNDHLAQLGRALGRAV